MSNNYVGAGILNIITESLYDNPIVVFREYVQNSVDSIFKETDRNNYEIKIWIDAETGLLLQTVIISNNNEQKNVFDLKLNRKKNK